MDNGIRYMIMSIVPGLRYGDVAALESDICNYLNGQGAYANVQMRVNAYIGRGSMNGAQANRLFDAIDRIKE